MRRTGVIVAVVCIAGCQTDSPTLLIDISSELQIPHETNNLVVRLEADGIPSEDAYALGTAPRDKWPQTLPVVAETTLPKRVRFTGELRVTTAGQPSVVVGYGEVSLDFPQEGLARASLTIPRACTDADDDGYGVGFGCAEADCDDDDPRAPAEYFCGAGPVRDGGVVVGRDGGPTRDAGPARPDGGVMGTPCGMDVCGRDEMCVNNACFRSCMDQGDCPEFHLQCSTRYGVCFCRLPCRDSTTCGPLECVDGCCQF